MGGYTQSFDVVDDSPAQEFSVQVVDFTRTLIGVHEEVFFKVRFSGRYQPRSIKFPNMLFGTSLRCKTVWFDYHPMYRVVWDDFDQTVIIIHRARDTELAWGDSFDFVINGRAFFSNIR